MFGNDVATVGPGEVAARVAEHAGARELAALLGVPASTIGAVLRRAGLPHLASIDRLTGEVVRGRRHSGVRYEHREPGSLLHVDVKKLGRIPPGGGWRLHGRSEDVRGRGLGWDYVHVAVDDYTRLAYAEALPNERAVTCAAFLHRAVASTGAGRSSHHVPQSYQPPSSLRIRPRPVSTVRSVVRMNDSS